MAEGDLCYKKGNNSLAYKKEGENKGSLIYKVKAGGETTISFAWASTAKDLDICAYWEAGGNKVGYQYNAISPSPYSISWSGDKTGNNESETLTIRMTPWSSSTNRKFKIHLNFFGFDEEKYPGSECYVIANQANTGKSLTKNNVSCGTNSSTKATTSDPSVTIEFDEKGFLKSIN